MDLNLWDRERPILIILPYCCGLTQELEEEAKEKAVAEAAANAAVKTPFLDSLSPSAAADGNQLEQLAYLDEQRQKRQEDANFLVEEAAKDEEGDSDMPPGDYTVQV